MRSSDIRLKWVQSRLAHIINSTTKSRSETPHRLFSATDWKPSSLAKNSRSTRKGFPARAPQPNGRIDILGMSCLSRSKSALKANAWERRKWDHRTGSARCLINNKYSSYEENTGVKLPGGEYNQAKCDLFHCARAQQALLKKIVEMPQHLLLRSKARAACQLLLDHFETFLCVVFRQQHRLFP